MIIILAILKFGVLYRHMLLLQITIFDFILESEFFKQSKFCIECYKYLSFCFIYYHFVYIIYLSINKVNKSTVKIFKEKCRFFKKIGRIEAGLNLAMGFLSCRAASLMINTCQVRGHGSNSRCFPQI